MLLSANDACSAFTVELVLCWGWSWFFRVVQAFKDRLAVACGGFPARAKIQGSPTDKLEHSAGEEADVPALTRTVELSAS